MDLRKEKIYNEWLKVNIDIIEDIKNKCLEYDALGNYGGGVPLNKIVQLFNFMMLELERVQKELNKIKK